MRKAAAMFDVKTFTTEEANHLLPLLTEHLKPLEEYHADMLTLQVKIDALELVMDKTENEDSPNVREAKKLFEEINSLADEYNKLVDKIQGYGCYLKGIDPTLIDFFHTHEGRVVYLCWRLGEPTVSHWHEVGTGYGNRRPLSELTTPK